MGRTLRRRFPAADAGVLGVGFGVAEKRSAADPGRGQAACFLVRRKGHPPTKRGQIPAVTSVRVRRGGRFVEVVLPTDVIEIDPASWQRTRRTIRHAAVSQNSAASNLIAWRRRLAESYRWGSLTVGHPFWGVGTVPDPESLVRVTMPPNEFVARGEFATTVAGRQDEHAGQGGAGDRDSQEKPRRSLEAFGRLIARTGRRAGAGIDAAVIRFDEGGRQADGGLREIEPRRLRVRSPDELASDVMRAGVTRTAFGEIPFVVRRYYPEFNLIAEVGRIRDVVEVESPVSAAFAPGSSGNLWTIEGQPACLQFAGYLDPASPSLSYRRGLGQPMAGVLGWARERIATMEDGSPDGIDLRLAAVF